MSAVVHVLKTARATFWTGPQVFQTVHYMACREKIRRMYRTVQYSTVQYRPGTWRAGRRSGGCTTAARTPPPPPHCPSLQLAIVIASFEIVNASHSPKEIKFMPQCIVLYLLHKGNHKYFVKSTTIDRAFSFLPDPLHWHWHIIHGLQMSVYKLRGQERVGNKITS